MSVYPHTHMFHSQERCIFITGPHIQVLDAKSGDLLFSTALFEDLEHDAITKSGPIRCAAVDRAFEHLATTGEDKKLKIWAVEGLKVLSEWDLPKRPTQIMFTRDGQTIIVSDKFGDVFSYSLVPEPIPETLPENKNDTLASHENPSAGRLVLGHTSLLTSFALSEDQKYIITADRDEHIRVSWYPQGYNIQSYCLGHKKFVSAIHIPSFAPEILISGGGDAALKVWIWHSGQFSREIPIVDAVTPYIMLRPKRRRWGEGGNEEDEGEGSRKPHGRKGQRKNKQKAGQEDEDVMEAEGADEDMVVGDDAPEMAPVPEAPEATSEESSEPLDSVLVVQKIDAVEVEGRQTILFSAVGATALFWSSFQSSSDPDTPSHVYAHDFGYPVLDFVSQVGSEGHIFVSLDTNWSAAGSGASPPEAPNLRLVKLSHNSITEVDSPLVASINSKCSVSVAASDLAALDLYAHLTGMPKNTDVHHNPMLRDATPDGRPQGRGRQRQQNSAKTAGKMKTRMALLKNAEKSASVDRASKDRETKRAKSEGPGAVDGEAARVGTVSMDVS